MALAQREIVSRMFLKVLGIIWSYVKSCLVTEVSDLTWTGKRKSGLQVDS